MSQEIKNEQKVLLLKAHKLDDDKQEMLHKNMFVIEYESSLHKNMTALELFARTQCVVLDMTDTEQRTWYAQQKSNMRNIGNLRTVYLAKKGSKCDAKKTKETYGADNVIKYLPDSAKSAADFIAKLLTDHIPKVEIGRLAKAWAWVKRKISCS